ncbi:MAG: hypothetical protein ACKOVH_09210 [Actinomycetota bacterium]
MCGCLVLLVAAGPPRFAHFQEWLFDRTRVDAAFDSFWIPVLGFLFLPWTTLGWVVASAPRGGVSGFGWFLVVFAFVVDVTTYSNSHRIRSASRTA